MKQLRETGLSYGALGKMFRISRARVHQICSGYIPHPSYTIKKVYKFIMVRDNFECQWKEKCKNKKIEMRDLVVHHIDFNNNNNSSDNLITLCRFCHSGFHSTNHIDSKIEERMKKGVIERGKEKAKKFIDRNKKIVELRKKEKLTFNEIGKRFGICDQSASDAYHKEKQRSNNNINN